MNMFVPRSVARRSKQGESTPSISSKASKEAEDKVRSTVKESAGQAQKLEQLPGCATDDVNNGRRNIQTLALDSSKSSVQQESLLRGEAGDVVSHTVHAAAVGSHESDSDDSDEPVLSFSKQQRWPGPGEPVCVVCGRYGAYIVDRTDDDICSLECKAKCLMKLGIHLATSDIDGGSGAEKVEEEEDGNSSWVYREHQEVTSMTNAQCNALYKLVSVTNIVGST